MLHYLLVPHRNITFQVFCFYKTFCLDDATIRYSQYEPLPLFYKRIFYRHPIPDITRNGGHTRGKSCTWTRWTCACRLPIIQWSVSHNRLCGVIFQCCCSEVRWIPIDFPLQELSHLGYKDKETYRDERRKHCKSLYCDRFLTFERWLVRRKRPTFSQFYTQLIVIGHKLSFWSVSPIRFSAYHSNSLVGRHIR